jgi:phospholipase D1/2
MSMTRASPPDPRVETKRSRTGWIVAVAFIGGLVVLAAAWRFTPLARLADPAIVVHYRDQVRDLPLAPLVVAVAFMISGFFAAPATLMIGATMLLFGPVVGALYAWLGMLANGSLIFAVTRRSARDVVERWLAKRAGGRADLFSRGLAEHGFVAVLLMRLLPVPYTLQNVAVGTSRIGWVDFLGGTALGVLPVIAVMAGVTTEFDAWLDDPAGSRLALLTVAVVAAFVFVAWLARWAARRIAARGH